MKPNTNTSVFEKEATVQDWDEDYYHPLAERNYDRAIPWMLAAMGAQPGDLVLDAGCGPGVHSIRAAKYGCRVHAIDISTTMLDHAKKRALAEGVIDQISFNHADLVSFKPEQPYRYVFSWGVIIHIPEVDEALEHIAAAVAPGGALALQVLSEGSMDFMIEGVARRLLSKPLKGRVSSPLGTGNWYELNGERLWVLRFNIRSLDERLSDLGFVRVARQTSEFTEFQRRLSGMPRKLLIGINRLMGRFNFLSSISATQVLVYKRK